MCVLSIFMKKSIATVVGVLGLISLSSSANAFYTGNPYKDGSNAAGKITNQPNGGGIPVGTFHDIDRRSCGTFGCRWLDGTNKTADYYPDIVYRSLDKGTHSYRHQVSTGTTTGSVKLTR